MCQLCTLKTIASSSCWPKALERSKPDLDFLVTSAHDEYTAFQVAQTLVDKSAPAPETLLDLLRPLASLLEDLEEERQKWWTSPEKRELRQRLEKECEQKKLSELHKINNTTIERIEAMDAKLGQFVRWSLGMNGGVWELMQCGKVNGGED